MRKPLIFVLTAAAMLATQAFAQDFGRMPTGYQAATETYLKSRMQNPRGMSVAFSGKPYRVLLDIGGRRGVPAWAVNVKYDSRIQRQRGRTREVVFFVNGRPVATSNDPRVRYRRATV
ncbi:MAG: hypothetical protein AAFX08_07720 [Pseudomonadota bacterium]